MAEHDIKAAQKLMDEIGKNWIVEQWGPGMTISLKDFRAKEGLAMCVGVCSDFVVVYGAPYDKEGRFAGNIEHVVIDYNDFNNFSQFSQENIYEEMSEILRYYFDPEQIEEIMLAAGSYEVL